MVTLTGTESKKGESKSFLPPPGLLVSFYCPFLVASKRDRGDGEESSLQGPSLCITKLRLEFGFKPLRKQLSNQHRWDYQNIKVRVALQKGDGECLE